MKNVLMWAAIFAAPVFFSADAQAAECANRLVANKELRIVDLIGCIQTMNTEIEELRSVKSRRFEVDAIPRNAVLILDDPNGCPTGWAPFAPANGRAVIGAYFPGSPTSKEDPTPRRFREPGGSETHTLSLGEMPRHSHEYTDFTARRDGPDVFAWSSGPRAGGAPFGDNPPPPKYTSPVGENKPHNNMPPFVALFFCKKEG